jgi:hypothetical protein
MSRMPSTTSSVPSHWAGETVSPKSQTAAQYLHADDRQPRW